VGQDTLLHGESLLVVAAGDAQLVALPLISEDVGLDDLAHTLLVEDTQLVLVDHLEQLLASRRGIGNVELQHTNKKTRHTQCSCRTQKIYKVRVRVG